MKVKIKGLPKQAANGIQVEDDNIKQLSPSIMQITGDSHKNGGEMVSYGNQTIEAQGQEPVAINNQGDAVFFGKLKIPGQKKTFETAAKNIAKEEVKVVKQADKAVALVNISDPYDKFESLSFNTGVVLGNAAQIKQTNLNQERESLGNLQQVILDTADQLGIDPKKVVKMKNGGTMKVKIKGIPQMQFGGSVLPRNWTLAGQAMPLPSYQQAPMGTYVQPAPIGNDEASLKAQIQAAANKYGISPELYEKQLFQESSLNPAARSKAGAIGIAQIMPACLSIDTRILTKTGWKYYNEVKIGEKIISYNPDTDQLEDDEIQELFVFDTNDAYRIYNKQFDFIATSDHRWYCEYKDAPGTFVHTTEFLSKTGYRPKIIRTKEYKTQKYNNIPDEFYMLLGIVIGDGSIDKRTFGGDRNGGVTIYQSIKAKPLVCEVIQKVIDTLYPHKNYKPGKVSEEGMIRWYIDYEDSISMYNYINENKEIVSEKLFELVPSQLEALRDGYLITDGWLHTGKFRLFGQSDLKRSEDFQLINFLLGKQANIKEYARKNETHKFPNGKEYRVKPFKYHTQIKERESATSADKRRMKYEKVNEVITVWCPRTKNKTWVASRNGYVTITGNTAKELGLTPSELKSTKPEDVAKQIDAGARYMSQLKNQFNGDETLALAAYNGGAKNIKGNLQTLAKRTGRNVEDLTGADWYNFMDTREDLPSGQKETVNYFNNLVNLPTDEFYSNKGNAVSNFQRDFYIPRPELSTPPIRTDNDLTISNSYTYQPDRTAAIPGFNDNLTNNTQASIYQDQIAARPQIPFNQGQPQDQFRPARNNFNYMSILPEIAAVLDRPDYVQGQQFTPTLYEPYRISMQDSINQNQANFNQVAQLNQNNPASLATLAGQLYGQNQQVLGNEFRANQQVANQVGNQNTQLLNQAELQNLQLADTQYQRQEAARAITDQNRANALTSISDKVQQNQIFNRNQQLAENMFNFRPDENYQLQYVGPDAQFNFNQPIQGQQLTPEQQKAMIEQQRLSNQTRRVQLQEQQQLRRSQNNYFPQFFRGNR